MSRLCLHVVIFLVPLFAALSTGIILIGHALHGDIVAFASVDSMNARSQIVLFDVTHRMGFPLTEPIASTSPIYSFSPDGNWLSIGQIERGRPYLDILSVYGDEVVRVELDSPLLVPPVWQPDCTALAYTISPGRDEFYIISPDGEEVRHYNFLGRGISFSPDGTALAFSSYAVYDSDADTLYDDIFTMRIGDDFRARTPVYENRLSLDISPLWSPDGQYIAFMSEIHYPRMSTLNILDTRNNAVASIYTASDAAIYGVVWSPDSQRLAFLGFSLNTGFYVIDRDGSTLINLSPFQTPSSLIAWSLDSQRVAFALAGYNREDLFISSFDGVNQYCITCASDFISVVDPFWMP